MIRGELKIDTMFTCVNCLKQEYGSVAKLDVEVSSFDALKRRIEDYNPPPYHMPVGWSSHYSRTGVVYKCRNCTGA